MHAGTGDVGVCYGTQGDNLPEPEEVVSLYQDQGIGKMRIYEPFPDVLEALQGSDIEVMVGLPNKDLQCLAEDNSAAISWVQTNILDYYPSVNFRYIAIGNEVTPVPENNNSAYAQFVLRAMSNVFDAIRDAGLSEIIIVSASIDLTVIETKTNFPPSNARFRDDVVWFMKPILDFLSATGGPILTSVYPYFARVHDPSHISLEYVLFTKTSPEFTDNVTNLQYFNLFDAQLDALDFAMEKILGTSYNTTLKDPNLSQQKLGMNMPDKVVTETGHPKAGGKKKSRRLLGTDETINNACTYYRNVIGHVSCGTPKRPGVPIETYLFAMFDENKKDGDETERHFGLFYPDEVPACQINFRE
ncbi:hypothetical protein ACHQM5_029887 [Ranunculus cassubicifolius]